MKPDFPAEIYEQILQSRDRSIQRLLDSLQAKEVLLQTKQIIVKEQEIARLSAGLRELSAGVKKLEEICEERNVELASKEREIQAKEREIQAVHGVATERLKIIQLLELEMTQARRALAESGGEVSSGDNALIAEATDLRMQLVALRRELQAKTATVGKLEREVVSHQRAAGSRSLPSRKWQQIKSGWLERLAASSPHPLAKLNQHLPRPLIVEKFPSAPRLRKWPRICIATPSYQQSQFLERTMLSVLDQGYPNLAYGVQDGGSTDGSVGIITRHVARLAHAESTPDNGQADAIRRGFDKLYAGRDDIMGWLNSDDVLMPGALHFIGAYFAKHPEVDVIYGHRVVIDEQDREIGRWFLPRYHADTLKWFDLVPQETMFWRASCFEQIGGMDPSFQFALDWDLLLRFEQAGFNIRRVPYFLGCFRVHTEQKTSARIQTIGEQEMQRLRHRTHKREVPSQEIHRHLTEEIQRSALVEWLHRHGLRY